MGKTWFRARMPDEGQGYGVGSAEGLFASAIFVLVLTLSAVLPPLAWGISIGTVGGCSLLIAAEVYAFLRIVRAHSDWRG